MARSAFCNYHVTNFFCHVALSYFSRSAIFSDGLSRLFSLAHLAELFILAGQMLYVCLYVNQGGTNRNRCTQKLVILHA